MGTASDYDSPCCERIPSTCRAIPEVVRTELREIALLSLVERIMIRVTRRSNLMNIVLMIYCCMLRGATTVMTNMLATYAETVTHLIRQTLLFRWELSVGPILLVIGQVAATP